MFVLPSVGLYTSDVVSDSLKLNVQAVTALLFMLFPGWFMGVTSVNSDRNHTALLRSPTMHQSSATCRLLIRYFIWDSGEYQQ